MRIEVFRYTAIGWKITVEMGADRLHYTGRWEWDDSDGRCYTREEGAPPEVYLTVEFLVDAIGADTIWAAETSRTAYEEDLIAAENRIRRALLDA